MRLSTIITTIIMLVSTGALANEINMQDGVTVTSCAGTIYDYAGPNGSVQSVPRHQTLTIQSDDSNKAVQLVFEEMCLGYSSAFRLRVYDGPDTQSPLLADFTTGCNNSPWIDAGMVANSGTMTLLYTSISMYPGSETAGGWKAVWNCVPKSYNMSNSSVSVCSGALHDPGGAAGSDPTNATYVFTINPENSGQAIAIDFPFLNLWTSDLTIYDGPNSSSPVIWSATGVMVEMPPQIARSGSMTIKLEVSGSTAPNFFGVWHCIDLTGTPIADGSTNDCEGTLYDSGGLNDHYSDNENYIYTVSTDDPNTVIDFRLLEFGTEYSYDTLWIYDGPIVDASQILLTGSGYLNGPSILVSSSTGAMTFRFKSDSGISEDGFVGNWSCRDTVPSWTISTETGISTLSESSVLVYPNPSTGAFRVDGWMSTEPNSTLLLRNIQGQTVYSKHIPSGESVQGDVPHLTSGVYILELFDRTGSARSQIVID